MSDPLSADDGVDYNYDDVDYGGDYENLEHRIRDVRAHDRDVQISVRIDKTTIQMIKMVKNEISKGGTSTADVTRALGVEGTKLIRDTIGPDEVRNFVKFNSLFTRLLDICRVYDLLREDIIHQMPDSNFSFESHYGTRHLSHFTVYWRDSIHSEIEDNYCQNLGISKSDIRRLVIMCGLTKSKNIIEEGTMHRRAMKTLHNFKDRIDLIIDEQEELFVSFLNQNKGSWLTHGMSERTEEMIDKMLELMSTHHVDEARMAKENILQEIRIMDGGSYGPRY